MAVISIIILTCGSAWSAIINIPADYPTIQQGINASLDGDTVLVQPGTYIENINFNGHNIVLGSLFLTTGDTSYIEQTVIDGDSAESVIEIIDNTYNEPTLISGFTLQNGFSITGAGIYCFQSNPVISNNIIRDNMAITKGGGIRIDQSEPLIYNNAILNNTAVYTGKGGGIYCIESNVVIRKNRIAENEVYSSGGGIFSASNVYVLIDSNIIENNQANWGGGLDTYHTNIDILDNVFRQNTGDYKGGAIKCSDSTAIIKNNIITENYGGNGAGIYCDSVNAHIIENMISGNNSVDGGGGGIYVVGRNILIKSNTIINNLSHWGGGGIRSNFCMVTIINNIIDNNSVEGDGGGIYTFFGGNYIYGNIISHNNAAGNGGGINSYRNQNLQIEIILNNILYNNIAAQGGGINCFRSVCQVGNNVFSRNISAIQGGGIALLRSHVTLYNSILWDDSSDQSDPEIAILEGASIIAEYCDIEGGWPGEGNIDIDPLFKYPAGGNFHLMDTFCGDSLDSPGIDAGDPNVLDSLLDCSWGLGTTLSDMGAYGGGDSALVSIFNNLSPLPREFVLLQNYPNPFNASTTIEFALQQESDIELAVFDLLGRKLKTLFKGIKNPGKHFVIWDGTDSSGKTVASGIYYYTISNKKFSGGKKMLMIR